jgi:hypothetical protein
MPGHVNIGLSVEWNTPERILAPIRQFFGGEIDLDPCSNDTALTRAKVKYVLPHHNGLLLPWTTPGRVANVFINPPFGRCYLRDDLTKVYSSKEWTESRKLWKETRKIEVTPGSDVDIDFGISDEEASHYKATTPMDWIQKANREYNLNGTESILLLPAAVDTKVWQQHIFADATAVCWIRGRIQFQGATKGPCPMACALVYYGNDGPRFHEAFYDVLGVVTTFRVQTPLFYRPAVQDAVDSR